MAGFAAVNIVWIALVAGLLVLLALNLRRSHRGSHVHQESGQPGTVEAHRSHGDGHGDGGGGCCRH